MKIDELLDKYFEGKLPAKKSVNCAVSLPKRKCRSTCKRTAPIRLSEPGSNFNGRTDRGKIRNNRIGKGSTRTAEAFPSLSHILCCQRHCRRIAPASRDSQDYISAFRCSRKLCRHRRPAVYRRETGGSQSTRSPAERQLHG